MKYNNVDVSGLNVWLSNCQDSIQLATKFNTHKNKLLLLSINCEIKFSGELHSQWFLADLTIDMIRISFYFSLKYCAKMYCKFLPSIMAMI